MEDPKFFSSGFGYATLLSQVIVGGVPPRVAEAVEWHNERGQAYARYDPTNRRLTMDSGLSNRPDILEVRVGDTVMVGDFDLDGKTPVSVRSLTGIVSLPDMLSAVYLPMLERPRFYALEDPSVEKR